MNAAARLEVIEQLFFTDRRQAMEKLSDLVESVKGTHRAEAMQELVRRVDHDHPGFAAYLALAGGALVEDGEESGTLGRALVAPLVRALVAAGRMLDHVAHLPDAELDEEEGDDEGAGDDEDDDDEDEYEDDDDDDEGEAEDDEQGHVHAAGHGNGHAHDHDHDDHAHAADEERAMIGTKAVDRATLDDIAGRDLVAVQAWFSMDIWYRPAVATWTRDPAILREVQGNRELRAALARLGSATETSHWLSLLVETVFDAPFVLVFPETGEAWRLTADGVNDVGQLSVLLSAELREPLARVGVSDFADADCLAVMRGEGPQQGSGSYGCAFHCYPVEAADPESGMPRDEVHTWSAPGGTGTHSLPGDFLPGTLAPIEGARVLLVVGPNAPGTRFVRGISAVRTFEGLEARVSGATRLSADEARRWLELAKSRGVRNEQNA